MTHLNRLALALVLWNTTPALAESLVKYEFDKQVGLPAGLTTAQPSQWAIVWDALASGPGGKFAMKGITTGYDTHLVTKNNPATKPRLRADGSFIQLEPFFVSTKMILRASEYAADDTASILFDYKDEKNHKRLTVVKNDAFYYDTNYGLNSNKSFAECRLYNVVNGARSLVKTAACGVPDYFQNPTEVSVAVELRGSQVIVSSSGQVVMNLLYSAPIRNKEVGLAAEFPYDGHYYTSTNAGTFDYLYSGPR